MANPEHIEILKRGVEAWNKWRNEAYYVASQSILAYPIGVDLNGADLTGAKLGNANLEGADLIGTNLNYTDLRNAILRNARLVAGTLIGANLRGADLTGTDLGFANLHSADLDGADLTNTILGSTLLTDSDLSKAKGLETIRHGGPSSIGIDTIYKSQGNIPEVFLRRAGVPDDFITYMRSLTGKAIDFYTCFISFTEADDAFSELLYNNLQANGVRCWRWKEDAKWGKTLIRSIDEAVRVYDKLIVICSEQSLNAPPVIREIERALQKEDNLARQGEEGEVLFPIRLDDYIFTGWSHHRKADVTAKNVGDFRQWKSHDAYQKAFDRLLRDLKAEDRQAAEG